MSFIKEGKIIKTVDLRSSNNQKVQILSRFKRLTPEILIGLVQRDAEVFDLRAEMLLLHELFVDLIGVEPGL